MRALIVGEALIDVVVSAGKSEEHVGGSAVNVAVALARLTDAVTLLTSLGSDSRAETMSDYLRLNGVDIAGLESAPKTSMAVARIAVDGSASYEFDLHWPAVMDPGGIFDVVHVGSIGLFVAPGAASVREIVESRRSESLITVDPNIRPNLIGPLSIALAQFEAIAQFADVVKMSDEDAAWLYPRTPADAVLERMLDLGARFAVITQGPNGSVLASRAARVTVPSEATVTVDTIGAGDTYMAALIHLLPRESASTFRAHDGFDAAELTRMGGFASNAAAITVSRRGGNPPKLAELQSTHL